VQKRDYGASTGGERQRRVLEVKRIEVHYIGIYEKSIMKATKQCF
jgi:hypothetical protein